MTCSQWEKLLHSKWLTEEGPNSDIVISSRIRLARNAVDLAFPSVFNKAEAEKILNKVKEVVERSQETSLKLELLELGSLTSNEREILVEKHLISPKQANNLDVGALVINQDESLSIMVNEEDHLRFQSILPGLSLNEAWELANRADDFFEEIITYAFSEEKGYLTCCPTNVGTGLRASVMVHLPGLVMSNQISSILRTLPQLGLTVRGLYGEGTDVAGDIFQISNQVTLGNSEEELIGNINLVIGQIMDKELLAREKIYKENKFTLEDKIFRSLGLMRYARVLNSVDALNLISNVRLGVSLNIIKDTSLSQQKELMVLTRPALLERICQDEFDVKLLDVYRAKLCRESLTHESMKE